MSLTVSCCRLLSLTVSNCCCLSVTVYASAMELLHVSHCLSWLLAVPHHLSGPIELLHISHCF